MTREWGRRWALGLVLALALPTAAAHGDGGDKTAWVAHHKKHFYHLKRASFTSVSCHVTSSALTQTLSELTTQRDEAALPLSIHDTLSEFRLVFDTESDRMTINAPQLQIRIQNPSALKNPEQAQQSVAILTSRFSDQVHEVRMLLTTLFDAYTLSRFADRARVTFEPTDTGYTAQYTSLSTERVVKTTFRDGALVEEVAGERDLVRTHTTYAPNRGNGWVVDTIERHVKAATPQTITITVKHQRLRDLLIPSEVRTLTRTATGHETRSVEERITLSSCTVKR